MMRAHHGCVGTHRNLLLLEQLLQLRGRWAICGGRQATMHTTSVNREVEGMTITELCSPIRSRLLWRSISEARHSSSSFLGHLFFARCTNAHHQPGARSP